MDYLKRMEEYNKSIGTSGLLMLRIIGLTLFVMLIYSLFNWVTREVYEINYNDNHRAYLKIETADEADIQILFIL